MELTEKFDEKFDGFWFVTITSARWWAWPVKWICNRFGTVKIIRNGIGRNVTGIFPWGEFVVRGYCFWYDGFFDSLQYGTDSEDVFSGEACTYVGGGKSFLKFEMKRL